jgi:basic membrane protein A and related proteins
MLKFSLKAGLAALAIVSAPIVAASAAPVSVIFVTPESGLGDKSFSDQMYRGLQKAQKDMGITFSVIQPGSISNFQSSLARAAAQKPDLIVGSSFDMIQAMKTVSSAFPNQKFGMVDVGPDPINPNVVSTVTKDWEGSFLVGWEAAKTSKTGTIGFVGGKDIGIIHRFFIGYFYGAKMARPDVKVVETYTGSFTDPAGGKEYTIANVNKGADINFAVAGPTSVGVIEGAKDTKTLAIGVDSDMNCYAKGSVLTSMVKRVDTQTYEMVKSVVDGSFKGGVVKFYGLAEDGVEAAMDDCNKGLISDAVLQEVDGLKAKLLSGEIVVPNYFDLKPGQKEMGKPAIASPPSLANATSLAQ